MKDFIQDKTEKWAVRTMREFTSSLCLFYCYLYCAGTEFKDEKDAFDTAERMRLQGVLDDDGTVLDGPRLLEIFTGRKWKVEKKAIDERGVNELTVTTPVRFDYNGKSHWVVMSHGDVVFDPIENSQCVKYGKPASARLLSW